MSFYAPSVSRFRPVGGVCQAINRAAEKECPFYEAGPEGFCRHKFKSVKKELILTGECTSEQAASAAAERKAK